MPPKTTSYSNTTKFLILAIILVMVGWFFYTNQAKSKAVKDFFSKGGGGDAVIQSIKKEINNSGKLIAKYDSPISNLTNAGVFSLTNVERTKAGFSTFSVNAKLNEIASIRMKDMFAKQYFEHVSPSGDSASKEADVVSYEYISIGENIALGNFKDDAALVLAWMNSPGHRANILNTKFIELGVAVGRGEYEGRQTWIAVQIFGKPLSACPATDANLKASIDAKENEINSDQNQLATMKVELDAMRSDPRTSRQEYNQKVNDYNAFVSVVNNLITEVKSEIAAFNVQVAAFNACI
jgi:uncharacterized protein YkwD